MPKFTVEAQTSHAPQAAFTKLKTLLDKDADLRRFDSKYSCEFDEQKLTGLASGGQFKAALQVEPASGGSKVAITVDLPFALSLFKGKIQNILQEKLNAILS
jgi:hypothetical protein